MSVPYPSCLRAVLLVVCLFVSVVAGYGQSLSTTLRGQVTDPSGAAVPNATVTVTGEGGLVKAATTNAEGRYTVPSLPGGKVTVRIGAVGFGLFESVGMELAAGRTTTLDTQLTIASERQEVVVADRATVDVDPSNNAGAVVLRGADLEVLSENPEDLAAELQALAGPAAGPNGGQIFIDGFSGGQLPPKESIREIRVNSNPFAAEYDRPGFGRVEIFTKPGTDRFRGQTFFQFGDEALNSRNPFVPNRSPYQARQFGGNISGPLTKKSSFFLDIERRAIDENVNIFATVVDPTTFGILPFQQAFVTPQQRLSINPRFDYALNANNTLVARYGYNRFSDPFDGLTTQTLPELAVNRFNQNHTVQISETAVLSPRIINEVRFQFLGSRRNSEGDISRPAINVLDAFRGGSNQIGLAFDNSDRYELQNILSWTRGAHLIRMGGRFRAVRQRENSPQNFGGTFQFAGGTVPTLDGTGTEFLTSIQRYQRTLQLLAQGFSIDEVRQRGGGASQFSISAGQPLIGVDQNDLGLFLQDDWRVRPNLTVSAGLRWETQTNISDQRNFAPRVGFAWALGGNQQKGRAPTVIRGGFGIFFDRFSEDLTLEAFRLNGSTQQQFILANPNFFSLTSAPTVAELQAQRVPQAIRVVDQQLRAPYLIQLAIGAERPLFTGTSLSVTFTRTTGVRQLRSRNINAPLPGSGVRPYGDVGNLFLYEATGRLEQNQLITNINTRLGRRLTLFGFYALGKAMGDTDGAGTFPADQYNLEPEWSRTSYDVRHRLFLGTSLSAPFGVRLSPFISASSGSPYNITIGRDLNGDTILNNDRPSLAGPCGEIARSCFNLTPGVNDVIIPRNYGEGPGRFSVNMRLSRTWGFGERPTAARGAGASTGTDGGGVEGPRGGGPGGGGRGGFGGGGGGRGGRGGPGGGGGFGGFFGDQNSSSRYNLTFTASAQNLLNNVNLATPVGNLSSALFGQSIAVASGFGGRGGGGGGGSAAGNRRIELQLRFSF